MKLLRGLGVISSHDFGIKAALKAESRIPEGTKYSDGGKRRRATLPHLDRLKPFDNPKEAQRVLAGCKGLGSSWVQFADDDGRIRFSGFGESEKRDELDDEDVRPVLSTEIWMTWIRENESKCSE